MLKKIISIVPVAALSLSVSANASTITVQKGDTLWDLANANNTSVENIQIVNNLTTDLIHPGDVLTIAPQKQYTVKLGDTLWDIALDHEVTVSQIKEWNQLHTDLIHPDLNLIIFEGSKTSDTAVKEKPMIPAVQAPKVTTSESKAPSANNDAPIESTPKAVAPNTSNETSTEITPKATVPSTSNTGSKGDTAEAIVPTTNNEAPKESIAPPKNDTEVKEISVEATAYSASCEGCTGITAIGIDLKANPDAKVISVDPSVIPLGSKVYVEGYGEAIAGDTGGNIKGNRIDVFVPSQQEAASFGVKQLKVRILD